MKTIPLLHSPPLLVEIGPGWLKARRGPDGIELPLELGPDNRLTAAGKAKVTAALANFIKPKAWLPRPRAWCAISARGVTLRRLSLPGGAREEFHQRLLLQIEMEFPLPPDELAWGYQTLGQFQPSNGAPTRVDVLVVALRKDLLADYQDILRDSGTDPVFTLAAAVRQITPGSPASSFALLDIGGRQAELTLFEHAVPQTSRILFAPSSDGKNPITFSPEALAQSLKGSLNATKVFVSGVGLAPEFSIQLAHSLGVQCELLPVPTTTANTAAIAGLEKIVAQNHEPALQIRTQIAARPSGGWALPDWKYWGTRLAWLLAACLLLPYAEALLLKPHLEKKVAAFKSDATRLDTIDRELDFLQNLKLSQPPYLDVLYVFSKSVPPGTRFDALSLNSHGEVSLRAAFHDGQQVADFRGKLIATGFFTNVVVEEQLPTPDRQRVNIRLSALEKNFVIVQQAAARLTAEEAAKTPKPIAAGATAAPGVPPKKELP